MKSNTSIKDIAIKNINGRTVLGPVNALTHKNCDQLDKLFKDFLSKNIVDIVINMNAVSFLDSCALELLVEMQSELKKKGRDLILSDVNDVCRDILICTRLIKEFRIITTKHSNP